jgi:hypothetical protein
MLATPFSELKIAFLSANINFWDNDNIYVHYYFSISNGDELN